MVISIFVFEVNGHYFEPISDYKLTSLVKSNIMGNKKILVAEDSSVIQNITKRVLQFQNYQIVSVKNGKQVLDKIEKDTYAAILLDINMPVMDGMECAKAIRSNTNPAIANIPIIAITGNAKNYSMEDFKAVGINEYIPKPLDFDKLVTTVNKLTGNEE